MPPGTGDVPLTVFQSYPIDGIIVVSSPEELVSMVVAKSINMAKMMYVDILGVAMNMAYVKCPKCDEKIVVCGFGCCPAFTCQLLFEKNPVGAVKRDAKAVACKFPVRLRFNFFFERVEKLLDSKGAVLDKV